MSRETDDSAGAQSVLRDIWQARQQSSEDLEGLFGKPKVCKAMRHIGNEPVDEDQRAAWRERLEREGKIRPDGESVRDLVFGAAENDR